jgi:hypothetical protein
MYIGRKISSDDGTLFGREEQKMTQHIELSVTLGFLGVLMWGMMKFMLRDIHKDLVDLRNDISDLKKTSSRAEERIDHLYQICIDLLKEKK